MSFSLKDENIIGLYFERNEKAIAETDKKYGKLCFSIAHNILQSAEDSKECVNDTYLHLWNSIPPVKPKNFPAFISKVARFVSFDRYDFLHAKKRFSEGEVPFEELEEVLPDDRMKKETEDSELGEIIDGFLRKEKPDSRNVFIRRYYFCDSVSEIAKRFAFSESKVKSMLGRTRKRLREYLEKEGVRL